MNQSETWPTPPADVRPATPTVRRRQRMVPRPPAQDDGPVVNRDFLTRASRSTVKPQTRRSRQLVGSLPDWEPMPPGEITVSKPHVTP